MLLIVNFNISVVPEIEYVDPLICKLMYYLKNQLTLRTKMKYGIFGLNKYYGITQDSIIKNFMIIIDNYILDDLKNYIIDHLLYKSENKVIDDFIRYT